MNRANRKIPAWRVALLTGCFAALLAGCGGGGNSGQPDSIVGVVIDGPIQGATVCLDLNQNVICDADEPVSGLTNALGQFAIENLDADTVAMNAPLLAEIPIGAVDADNPGQAIGTPYQLSAPGGQQRAVISPLTELLQTGVRAGLSLPDARIAVAAQAGVPVSLLETDYTQASNDPDSDALADFASEIVVPALQAGQVLRVDPPFRSLGPRYTVTRFRYVDNANYTIGTVSLSLIHI